MKFTLNAGHGKMNDGTFDSGAVAKNGFTEASETIEVVNILASFIKASGNEVLVIQDGDLADITNRSNTYLADYFISVHCNSASDSSAHGIETFALSYGGQGDKLAHAVQSNLVLATNLTDRDVKYANFWVLRYTDCPAILTEIGFISNQNEENLMKDSSWDIKVAKAIYKGICEATGIKFIDSNTSTIQSTPISPITSKIPILGTEKITIEQCNQFIRKVNPNAPDIAQYYKKYGEVLGIKWGLAFAQMIKETNYLRFGGDVLPSQNNYCGLGTVGGGVKGANFDTSELGVLAHLEHLYAYASKNSLPTNLIKVDPRFDLVTRGIATYWTDLNGKWAVPGNNYGEEIIEIYNQICKEVVKVSPTSNNSNSSSSVATSVPLKFSYPNNAKIMSQVPVLTSNGSNDLGHYVSAGDSVTILDISGSKQQILLQYPTPSGVRNGLIPVSNNIVFNYQNQWRNGSTKEIVYDENGSVIGSLNPYEYASPLYRKNGLLHVVYNISGGKKSGYVKFNGGFNRF